MAKRPPTAAASDAGGTPPGSGIDALLLAALERGDDSMQTGRFLITYKDGAGDEALRSLTSQNLRTADARDFADQAVDVSDVGDADAVYFPEIGVALVSGNAAQERGMGPHAELASDSPMQIVEPEYFVFSYAQAAPADYLRGFMSAAAAIARDLGDAGGGAEAYDVEAEVLGNTWGLVACKVPPSVRSGLGIRVAVLDTGLDVGHPDFAGRVIVTNTFVGQPVQDLHGHGTHTVGTSCGPLAPAGNTPRYGVAHRAQIYVGKVLSNAGSGSTASVLAGMNWAIANKCAVISMSLGSNAPVQAAYTAAGQSALNNGCLIVAAAGNSSGGPTGAPANSPTVFSVSSVDPNLAPSAFSSIGKVQLAGPGRDVFSSVPRPTRYGTMSGTSMATPHVAGCAALWAESNATLRGVNLWNKLLSTAKPLRYPATKVGRGLVQAP